MRQSLIRSFDQIYMLDLHGNAKKKSVSSGSSGHATIYVSILKRLLFDHCSIGHLIFRVTYYTGHSRGFHCYPRYDVMRHVGPEYSTSNMSANCFKRLGACIRCRRCRRRLRHCTKERGYLFPLYLYPPAEGTHRYKSDLSDNTKTFAGRPRIENIAPAFRNRLDEKYEYHFSPEEILRLHLCNPARANLPHTLRGLRIDFPRVPFPELAEDFETLSGLDWALVQAHSLRELPRKDLADFSW